MHRKTFKWCLILSCNIGKKARLSKIGTMTIKPSTSFVNVQQPIVCEWHEWVKSCCSIRQIDSSSNTGSCVETDTDSTHSCVYYPLSHIVLHHTWYFNVHFTSSLKSNMACSPCPLLSGADRGSLSTSYTRATYLRSLFHNVLPPILHRCHTFSPCH